MYLGGMCGWHRLTAQWDRSVGRAAADRTPGASERTPAGRTGGRALRCAVSAARRPGPGQVRKAERTHTHTDVIRPLKRPKKRTHFPGRTEQQRRTRPFAARRRRRRSEDHLAQFDGHVGGYRCAAGQFGGRQLGVPRRRMPEQFLAVVHARILCSDESQLTAGAGDGFAYILPSPRQSTHPDMCVTLRLFAFEGGHPYTHTYTHITLSPRTRAKSIRACESYMCSTLTLEESRGVVAVNSRNIAKHSIGIGTRGTLHSQPASQQLCAPHYMTYIYSFRTSDRASLPHVIR